MPQECSPKEQQRLRITLDVEAYHSSDHDVVVSTGIYRCDGAFNMRKRAI